MPSEEKTTQESGRKVMVIGLDGLTLKLLLPLVAQGRLPTFDRLMQQGAYGELTSVGNMTTGPTWASFATGCLPQRHGIPHDFFHLADGYALKPAAGADLLQPPFWELASNAGRRVVVLNVPMSYPAKAVNGAWLAGIDAPGERAAGFAYPADLPQRLHRQGVRYLIDCGLASFMQAGNLAGGRAAVAAETEGRTRAAEMLLADGTWDLFATVYGLPDVWQHYYWGAAPGSPGFEQMAQGYEMVDAHLARLLALAPADCTLIVASDHGFGPLTGTRDALNRKLAELGLLTYTASSPKTGVRGAALSAARKLVSFRRRQQLLASFPALRRRVETQLRVGGIDWAHTQVYAALDHLELWVNVRGRQPAGSVAAEAVDALCARVAEALLTWRDEESGEPKVLAVERNTHGVAVPGQIAPDLLLTWNHQVAPKGLHPLIVGDHTPDGTLLVAGPGVPPGPLPVASLCDVAPLALHALGLPELAAAMDGRMPVALHGAEGA